MNMCLFKESMNWGIVDTITSRPTVQIKCCLSIICFTCLERFVRKLQLPCTGKANFISRNTNIKCGKNAILRGSLKSRIINLH